jgi:hypothetical protein
VDSAPPTAATLGTMSDAQPNEHEKAQEDLAESDELEAEIVDPDEEADEWEPKGTRSDGTAPLP